MVIIDRAKHFFNSIKRGLTSSNDTMTFPYSTKSGMDISESNSLNISAIYSAITIIAGTVASLPRHIYRALPEGGSVKVNDHPWADSLRFQPNKSNMSSWDWIFSQLVHKYLWGNWYSYLNRDSYYDREIVPLRPDLTYRDPQNSNVYITTFKGKQLRLSADDVLHVPHFTVNGLDGKGVVHFAKESLGLSMALDQFASLFFANGAHAGGVVEMEKEPKTDADKKRLEAKFNSKYSGMDNSGKVVFISGGKFIADSVDPEKAQALQSRQFSVTEVARWMNLPPHIIKDLSRSTFSNIEAQMIEMVVYSLMPLITQIEQNMNIAFFDKEERRDHYVKFDLKGLLQGDTAARTAFYTAMFDRGVFNADHILGLEDMNPQKDGAGKTFYIPLNMIDKSLMTGDNQDLKINDESVKEEKSRSKKKVIQKRSGALRRKITISYKNQFKNYGKSVVGDETKAIRKIIKTKPTETEFKMALEKLYQEFRDTIESRAGALLSSYSSALLPVVQDEIASSFDIDTRFAIFLKEYTDYFTNRHVNSSKNQLNALYRKALEEAQDVFEELEARLIEWEEKRADKIVMRETVRTENAFAKTVFAFCGIAKIRSVAFGDSCPFCDALDGMVIGIEEKFLSAGEFQPEGADAPLIVSSAKGHAPYHDGCDCSIIAEV